MSNETKPQGHLLFVNAFMWASTGSTRTVAETAQLFEKDKVSYVVWYVPAPPEAEYEIKFFSPQVPGAYVMEAVEFKNCRKVKTKKGE